MTNETSDVDAVTYELDRLYEYLADFEQTPKLRERIIELVDYAARVQLATGIRGLRQTIRNVDGQVRGVR